MKGRTSVFPFWGYKAIVVSTTLFGEGKGMEKQTKKQKMNEEAV